MISKIGPMLLIKRLQLLLDLLLDLHEVHAHPTAAISVLLILDDQPLLYPSDLFDLLEVNLLRVTEIRDIDALSLPLDPYVRRLALCSLLLAEGTPLLLLLVGLLLVGTTDHLVIEFQLLPLLPLALFARLPLPSLLLQAGVNLKLILLHNPV